TESSVKSISETLHKELIATSDLAVLDQNPQALDHPIWLNTKH
ncbi:16385_t:CDS:1, partial [Dentiscutata erythropus]